MFLFPYFADSANFPFTVALVIVLILAAIEGVGMLIGAGVFSFLDTLLPDLDVDIDLDIDAPDMTTPSITGQVLTWMRIGRVPVIFTLIVFLVAFGLIGLSVQGVVRSIFGSPLPALLACIPTFALSLPMVGLGNTALAAIIPQDETSAVSQNSLLGKMATITTGEAKRDYPAQAKLKDEFGQTHYVMVEPDLDDDSFSHGERLLLVRRESGTYFGIHCQSEGMNE